MPSTPRLQSTARATRAPDTGADPACATLRDNLAMGNQRLDALAPDALDLAAGCITLLATALRGQASRLCGQHAPDYRRGQLIGRNAITLPDLCWLAEAAPEALHAGLIPLAAAAGYMLQPLRGGPADVNFLERISEVNVTAAQLVHEGAAAQADGVLDAMERAKLRAHLERLKTETAEVEAQLAAGDPWRSEVGCRVRVHAARKESERG